MPKDRFYIDAPIEREVLLTGTELHHMHVMRTQEGDLVELVNGKGALGLGLVTQINKKRAVLKVTESQTHPLPNPKVHLAVPFMRPSKLELVVEKCIELGADAFYFYKADFSEKKEISEHQKERLEKLSISAMKQCGRLDLPPILYMPSFKKLIELKKPILYGDPEHAKSDPLPSTPALFVTGPEKGFSEKELAMLRELGTPASLGRYILRAETAPIKATCLLAE